MSDEDARVDMMRVNTTRAIDAAFAEHMNLLFANFIRHVAGMPDARANFRKDLAIARQVCSEMQAIANE